MSNRPTITLTLPKDMFEAYDNVLDTAQWTSAIQEALRNGKDAENDSISAKTIPSNYPAKGKYSTGETARSLDTSKVIEYSNGKYAIDIGWDLPEHLTAEYLIYGVGQSGSKYSSATRKMAPAKGLKNAIFGTAVRKQVKTEMVDTINDKMSSGGG